MRMNNVKRGNIFESIEAVKTPLSRHNLSYRTRLDCEMGDLIPFYVEKVCPGTTMINNCAIFGRMMPVISPIMDDIDIEVRYFYVPNRLLWKNFEDYITKKDYYDHPYVIVNHELEMQKLPYLADLLSRVGNEVITPPSGQYQFSLALDGLPYRAYYLIYNEYFRDENIQSEAYIDLDDGEAYGLDELNIMKVDWRKDYFTSALPWTQRGNMAQFVGDVYLNEKHYIQQIRNVTQHALVPGLDDQSQTTDGVNGVEERFLGMAKSTINRGSFSARTLTVGADADQVSVSTPTDVVLDPNGTLSVSFAMSELRMANAVQRYLERSALAGNRYTEYIMGMFGVHCSDSRLQRPEYLGGSRSPFYVMEITQNEQAQLDSNGQAYNASTPQGNLAGIGKLQATSGFNKKVFFPEYGIVMGLLYLRPKASYMNGIPKSEILGVYDNTGDALVQRDSLEVYYNPFFEHLGEEAVFNIELFGNGDEVDRFGDALAGQTSFDNEIFGYQSRNAFRKFRQNEVHGEFRTTLKHWTLAREFSNKQTLSDGFLKCNPSKRIFAVEDDSNHFIFDIYNKVDAVLPMSAYGTPRL